MDSSKQEKPAGSSSEEPLEVLEEEDPDIEAMRAQGKESEDLLKSVYSRPIRGFLIPKVKPKQQKESDDSD